MRVLQINSDFRYGSTGKITASLHDSLTKNGIDSHVCYGRYYGIKEVKTYSTITVFFSKIEHFLCNFFGDPYGFCFFSTKKVIGIIKKVKPDIVHLQCINGYFVNAYKLISWLANKKYKTVVTMHAEFLYTGGCDHAYECNQWRTMCIDCKQNSNLLPFHKKNAKKIFLKFKKSFSMFDTQYIRCVSVSQWLMNRASKSPILENFQHSYILNGIDTSVFNYRENYNDVLEKYKITEPYVLFVTAVFNPEDTNDNKGGRYILELAKILIKNNSNLKIIVAASYFNLSIKLPSNVVFIGKVSNQYDLANIYSGALVTLLTSERETFGMTIVESLCCGTPVVGFKAGGPESIVMKKYATFVEFANVQQLYYSLMDTISYCFDSNMISDESIKKFSHEEMFIDYLKLYENM